MRDPPRVALASPSPHRGGRRNKTIARLVPDESGYQKAAMALAKIVHLRMERLQD
jgi:hypothetical protein